MSFIGLKFIKVLRCVLIRLDSLIFCFTYRFDNLHCDKAIIDFWVGNALNIAVFNL